MTWDEVKELGPLYAIGSLDAETASELEAFLSNATADQQREFAEWQNVAALLPLSLPQTEVPARVKTDLMARIASETQSSISERKVNVYSSAGKASPIPKSHASRPFQRWLMMAATVALAFSSGYLAWQNSKITEQLSDSNFKLGTLQRQFEAFLSPSTRVISMNGVETPKAHAKVVWNTETQTWEVHIKNLPAPPTDKDYQLWYVTADAKINAAVFRTGENGTLELKLNVPPEALNGLAATAVTLEPKGGSSQPTGKFYLMAKI
jgi:anti-sigma-K factor RskA